MRNSCNGCRVLRKGCSDDCVLRPCLDWIKSPESQANATLFLAKFYGRAGLLNLINAGPNHLRPEIFRSLLYEACGRMMNPVYGSVGLLWSKNWDTCQSAVDAVLSGAALTQTDAAVAVPLGGCDIRHLSKDQSRAGQSRRRSKANSDPVIEFETEPARFSISGWGSHDSIFSAQTVEASMANLQVRSDQFIKSEREADEENEIGLELSLGYNQMGRAHGAMMGTCSYNFHD